MNGRVERHDRPLMFRQEMKPHSQNTESLDATQPADAELGLLPAWGPGPDPIAAVLEEYSGCPEARARGWSAKPTPDGHWLSFHKQGITLPEQGWKLHVSSTVQSAAEVLRRTLPVLLQEETPFKTAPSWPALVAINEGTGGLSQVGKFITVYPVSEVEAVRLAIVLDAVTRGLPGPPIPSDRRLAPESLVFYRYGGFGNLRVQMPWGEVLSAIRTPAGEFQPDRRGNDFSAPEWVQDPFIAAGIATMAPAPEQLVAGRYLPIARLSRTPRGSVFLAVDTVQPRRCILKDAVRHGLADRNGSDACDRLRNEADVLTRIAPDPRFPTLLDSVRTPGGMALVLEDVEGETLESAVREAAKDGRLPPLERLLRWAREIAEAMDAFHRRGLIFRDLKSSNVMIPPAGGVRLIDFEMSYDTESGKPFHRGGTRGYISPQQLRGEPPAVQDDVYSFGALLWFMATAIEPGRVPRYDERVEFLLHWINPTAPPALGRLVSRCLSRDPGHRPPSMAAVAAELSGIGPALQVALPLTEFDPEERQRFGELARRTGDSICGLSRPAPDGEGVSWQSTEGPGKNSYHRDVNCGTAGVLLALSEVADFTRDPEHLEVLRRGAHWLRSTAGSHKAVAPGLYVGEAGVGAALLRAGLVLDDRELLYAAGARSRWVADQPLDSPDLFNGAAGRLRFHLAAWDALADEEHLRAARAAGEWILLTARNVDETRRCWEIPAGFGGLSGAVQPGYAHGAAGIADALLDLYEATLDDRFLETARGAARWLESLAFPVLEDGSGVDWPAELRDASAGRTGPFWCHGAAGISRFLFHAAALELTPSAGGLGARAALAAGRGARWASPSQCHGLMGNLEALVDAYQATRDPLFLREARPLAELLLAYAVDAGGMLVWPFSSPGTHTPDLMIGFSGAAPCLLRLAEPEHRPHLLSRPGLTLSACSRGALPREESALAV